jgi:hypothetical protein
MASHIFKRRGLSRISPGFAAYGLSQYIHCVALRLVELLKRASCIHARLDRPMQNPV